MPRATEPQAPVSGLLPSSPGRYTAVVIGAVYLIAFDSAQMNFVERGHDQGSRHFPAAILQGFFQDSLEMRREIKSKRGHTHADRGRKRDRGKGGGGAGRGLRPFIFLSFFLSLFLFVYRPRFFGILRDSS